MEEMLKMKVGARNNEEENKTITNVVNTNPNISITTLNINGLNITFESQRLSEQIKRKDPILFVYFGYKKPVHVKTHKIKTNGIKKENGSSYVHFRKWTSEQGNLTGITSGNIMIQGSIF